jgi:hypothetical protein
VKAIVTSAQAGRAPETLVGVFESWPEARRAAIAEMIRIALVEAATDPVSWRCVCAEHGFERWRLGAKLGDHYVEMIARAPDTEPPISDSDLSTT